MRFLLEKRRIFMEVVLCNDEMFCAFPCRLFVNNIFKIFIIDTVQFNLCSFQG